MRIDNSARVEVIRSALEAAFKPEQLEIGDDSHRHAGHAGAQDGRGHFSVAIVSAAFSGMNALARHRAIYAALGDLMTTDIHALAIKAQTPAKHRAGLDADLPEVNAPTRHSGAGGNHAGPCSWE